MFFPNKLLHSTLGVQERYVEASGRSVEEEMACELKNVH